MSQFEEITHFESPVEVPFRTRVAIWTTTCELVLIHSKEYWVVVDFGSGFCYDISECGGFRNFEVLGDL